MHAKEFYDGIWHMNKWYQIANTFCHSQTQRAWRHSKTLAIVETCNDAGIWCGEDAVMVTRQRQLK